MSTDTLSAILGWLPVVIIMAVFLIVLKRARPKQKLMMDRQQEAVELLKEIRDLLKNK